MPNRENIITVMEQRLAAITVANGYRTTVARIDRHHRSQSSIPAIECPYIGIRKGEAIYEMQPSRHGRISMEVHLYMVVHAGSEDTADEAIDDLRLDVLRVINSNHTLRDDALARWAIDWLPTVDQELESEDPNVAQMVLTTRVRWLQDMGAV